MPRDGWDGLRAIGDRSTNMVVRQASLTTATCIHRPTGTAWLQEVGCESVSAG